MCVCSHVQLFATLWTVAQQASLSMGFSRQEYWSGLPFLLQRIFSTCGLNPCLLSLLNCKQILYHLRISSLKPLLHNSQLILVNGASLSRYGLMISILIQQKCYKNGNNGFPISKAKLVITRRRQWHPTPVLLPGKSHGRRGLVGYSSWGRKESDMTEQLHFHTLEKEMATHSSVLAWRNAGTEESGGLPSMGWHSQTRLKQLSSSSSSSDVLQ